MNYTHFIGIDVSKNTLDFAIVQDQHIFKQGVIDNTPEGVLALLKIVKELVGKYLGSALFCMEHTGIYNQHLLDLCSKKGLNMVLESPIRIQRSMGIIRGKNDQVDALRIARYVAKNHSELACWKAPRPVIAMLKTLMGIRSRLIASTKLSNMAKNEAKGFDKKAASEMAKLTKNSDAALKKDLAKVEAKIKKVVDADERLKELFGLITSVDGIGAITAVNMITATNEFKNFKDPSKFVCYVGVAPFEYRSGSSVRGRTRVSHQANKKMKTLLHMAALSVIVGNGEMKKYYLRKVAEGMNKMKAINAIRRKLIDRIFACVRDSRIYEKNYERKLA